MIGIAFAGGSVKGAYEIGVYYAFKKCHIKVDGFVGTSIGSFNAAMLAAGRDRQLLKFWQNVDVAKMLKLDEEFVKALNDKNIKGTVHGIKQIVTSKGLSTLGLKEILDELNIEEDIRNSKKDFGLVTVKLKPLTALKLFKEDIPKGKMNEFILGSCYHPVFKLEKIIDDAYYIDGGFYDCMPVNMLLDKKYDKIYAVDLRSIGVMHKIKDKEKTIIIKPSHSLGGQFTIDSKKINYNIKLGYYDALKILKNLDGHKYIFKKLPDSYYDKLLLKVEPKRIQELTKFFKIKNARKLIIAVVEYFMAKEEYEYCKVYNIKRVIRKLKKEEKILKLLDK